MAEADLLHQSELLRLLFCEAFVGPTLFGSSPPLKIDPLFGHPTSLESWCPALYCIQTLSRTSFPRADCFHSFSRPSLVFQKLLSPVCPRRAASAFFHCRRTFRVGVESARSRTARRTTSLFEPFQRVAIFFPSHKFNPRASRLRIPGPTLVNAFPPAHCRRRPATTSCGRLFLCPL